MISVYKLTRSDGKEYIGISKNFHARLSQHKLKANHWTKRGYLNGMLGKKHSDETKRLVSKNRSGIASSKLLKFDKNLVEKLREEYTNRVQIPNDFLMTYIKKSQRKFLNELNFEELITSGGQKVKYLSAFSRWKASVYNCNIPTIRNIVLGKTYRYDEINYK